MRIVVPPVRPLLGPVVLLPSGAAQVMLTGEAGETYSIQASADLAAWLPVGTVTITNVSGLASFNDTSAPGAESRFYRAVSR